jgi:capsular polysaccharide export protein
MPLSTFLPLQSKSNHQTGLNDLDRDTSKIQCINSYIKPVINSIYPDLKTLNYKKTILLLQGPVGPFFSELHQELNISGCEVKRILFNAGDKFLSRKNNCVCFKGTPSQWKSWLNFEFTNNKPDSIILFGSSRPAHKIARELAGTFGISVISLEEGYIRSGYITAELGGNNQYSPLINWIPSKKQEKINLPSPTSLKIGSTFIAMSHWSLAYYFFRDLLSSKIEEALFHRPREQVISMSFYWFMHIIRRALKQATEAPLRFRIHRKPGYIIIPLQVSCDSQLQKASSGWTTMKLINDCLTSLARHHPHQTFVFKLHPLERANFKIQKLIKQKAQDLGLNQAQFKIIHTGHIGDLTRHSSGMIVINSTSAFSALHHAVPLLVFGDAVFRHHAIATLGKDANDITEFLKSRHVKNPKKIAQFFKEVKSQSLVSGDFYVPAGRKNAIRGIIHKLDGMTLSPPIKCLDCK